jgi:alpha-tubulin suppressor-like RCC1 family protein
VLAAAACGDSPAQPQPQPQPQPKPVASVVVTPGALELRVGESRQVSATPKDAQGGTLSRAVTWRSSNAAVASVDANGNVQAVAAGTASITAAAEGVEGSAAVQVIAVTPVLEISKDSLRFVGMAATASPAPQAVQVSAQNGTVEALIAEISYAPAIGTDWLTASLSTVAAPSSITLTAATGSLLPGVYRASVTVRSITNAAVVPVRIDVAFEVQPGPQLDITASDRHNCAVDLDGTVYCWGYNGQRQLGVGSLNNYEPRPVRLPSDRRFLSVSTGELHACGITIEGDAFCWGTGFMGDGNEATAQPPRLVSGGHRWTQLAAGYRHTCGLTDDGVAWCWGTNYGGQVGNDTRVNQTQPVRVATALRFASLTAGEEHTCGVALTGDAYCWGRTAYGRLGVNSTSTDAERTPVRVGGELSWAALEAGRYHTCGITKAGQAYCWGYNGSGQLGDDTRTGRSTPTPVASAARFTAIAAGTAHSCAVSTTGQAYCWGYRNNGGVGNGPGSGYALVPTEVANAAPFRSITVGNSHSCGVTTADETFCWGYNALGVVGDGSTTDRYVPVRFHLR